VIDGDSEVRQDFAAQLIIGRDLSCSPDSPQISAFQETTERIPLLFYDPAGTETDVLLHRDLLKQSILKNIKSKEDNVSDL